MQYWNISPGSVRRDNILVKGTTLRFNTYLLPMYVLVIFRSIQNLMLECCILLCEIRVFFISIRHEFQKCCLYTLSIKLRNRRLYLFKSRSFRSCLPHSFHSKSL